MRCELINLILLVIVVLISVLPVHAADLAVGAASISAHVWRDLDRDGMPALVGEAGFSGVTVELYGDEGVIQRTTDQLGFVIFGGLTPGEYRVCVVPPIGYFVTNPNPAMAPGDCQVVFLGEVGAGDPVEFGLGTFPTFLPWVVGSSLVPAK